VPTGVVPFLCARCRVLTNISSAVCGCIVFLDVMLILRHQPLGLKPNPSRIEMQSGHRVLISSSGSVYELGSLISKTLFGEIVQGYKLDRVSTGMCRLM
jgi:hypothetical protein